MYFKKTANEEVKRKFAAAQRMIQEWFERKAIDYNVNGGKSGASQKQKAIKEIAFKMARVQKKKKKAYTCISITYSNTSDLLDLLLQTTMKSNYKFTGKLANAVMGGGGKTSLILLAQNVKKYRI